MKKYILTNKREQQSDPLQFDSVRAAEEYVINRVHTKNDFSLFDFSIKEIEYEDASVTIPSYEDAVDRLEGIATKTVSEVRENHVKALEALNKLFTIADAWNKVDGFIPDFTHIQFKYRPQFIYDGNDGKFIFLNTGREISHAYTSPRLYFKTKERAEQFGTQFIELWRDFLSITK